MFHCFACGPFRDVAGRSRFHRKEIRPIRKYLDWWPIQIEFHRATGNPVYLEALVEDVRTDPFTRVNEIDLSRSLAVAYLLHHGYTEADLGAEKIGRMREALAQRRWGTNPPRTRWNYGTLVRKRATFQTFKLGCRAANAPVAFTRFDSAEASE